MHITPHLLARLSDVLIVAGASSLFLTFLVGNAAGEQAARVVFAALLAVLVAGVWLRLLLWERTERSATDRRR